MSELGFLHYASVSFLYEPLETIEKMCSNLGVSVNKNLFYRIENMVTGAYYNISSDEEFKIFNDNLYKQFKDSTDNMITILKDPSLNILTISNDVNVWADNLILELENI